MDVYKQNMNVQCIILDQRLSVERGIPVSGVARLRCELAMLKYRWTLGRALPRFRLPPSNSQWIGLIQNLHRKP